MATSRKTTVVLKDITPTQAEEAFADYATANSFIKKKTAEMELQITKVREKYQSDLADQVKILEAKNAVLMQYALENEQLFDKKKSIDLTHGTIGFRTSTPAIKALKGFTLKSAAVLIKEFMGLKYIRTVEEINREAIIADREDSKVTDLFPKCGIEVVQNETFFVEPKEEAVLA
jgi:phage host-nuclease inhibitor protein Gam